MVKSISNQRTDGTIVKRPFRVVELVGPAGAGKTTLSRELRRRNEGIRIDDPPCVRRDNIFFVKQGLLVIPTLLYLFKNNKNGRYPTLEEIAWLTILDGWHRLLQRETQGDGKVVVIDQGAIYLMAELRIFGPEHLRSQKGIWWDRTYKQWALTLDMVVYLDTSNIGLLKRIRRRDMWHVMKERPKPEVLEFLAQYRSAYEQVISSLVANNNKLKVLYFDTGIESAHEISNKLLREIGLSNDGVKPEIFQPDSLLGTNLQRKQDPLMQ